MSKINEILYENSRVGNTEIFVIKQHVIQQQQQQ